ncbi:MAG: nif-specific transcriptional activator NifA [Spirochaetales bacterium]|uniref:Nif-specific regulatory protein n=1 Tax=Candidatus Thalassospirochaeta sargassi TaxID=3119039 RepID=A0AAJ1MLU0_9SPIO|nr:nif-specific transcriptional activator NifA [Spirochaetales bacterium]
MTDIRDSHYRRQVIEQSALYEISSILDGSEDLQHAISPILDVLADQLDMKRSTVTLLNRLTDEVQIEAAHGLSEQQRIRGRYSPGEGIIGRVIKSGEYEVIPDISDEPDFLDRTQARASLQGRRNAFICLPIKIEGRVIGTLSIDRVHDGEDDFSSDVRFLSIVASMIAQAVKVRRRVQEEKDRNKELQKKLENKFTPTNIIGKSNAMREVFDLVEQVSNSSATVLIRGESGTGKELVAQAIHYNSPRAHLPFIKVNCAALPESVIESELFGHEKGAFTSAIASRKGRFELAHNGTIFLDEIGELSPMTQVKLLRVLQEQEFERVGGTETIKINVRVIAATNRPLEEMMTSGEFREDLYYRLNVFPVNMPPLRERKSDIILIADAFAEKYGKRNNKEIKRISTPAIELLMSYHWPGNVRELENCIERAVLLTSDGVIHGNLLPPSLQSAESTDSASITGLQAALDRLEVELLEEALKSTKGNMAKAARLLEITERKMGLRVAKYGIDPKKYGS